MCLGCLAPFGIFRKTVSPTSKDLTTLSLFATTISASAFLSIDPGEGSKNRFEGGKMPRHNVALWQSSRDPKRS